MNTFKKAVLSSLIAAVQLVGLMPALTMPVWAAETDQFKAGEFLVKFKGNDEIYRIKTSADSDINQIIGKLGNHAELEYVEPNYTFDYAAFPNDPDYRFQWYHSAIDTRNLWSKELLLREQRNIKSESVIAVLDTGVDLDHPDLVSKIWKNTDEIPGNGRDDDANGYVDDVNGWDFVDADADSNPSFAQGYVEDAVKHGTLVAGLAAASVNNGEGIAGVSWYSKIMPLRVLDSSGSGDVFSVVQAIDYAVKNGADVINMSFVGQNASQSLLSAIKRAYNSNVLVVAAAGNTDPSVNGVDMSITKSYPVCYDGDNGENIVIGVASVGKNLVKSNFSNYGDCIDIVAPGDSFYTTQVYDQKVNGFNQKYSGYWSGTSLSAPLVSGVLATMKEIRPELSAPQIRDLLLDNTIDVYAYNAEYKGKLGQGLLNASQVLEATLKERPAPGMAGEGGYIVVGLGSGSFPQIKVLKPDGSVFKEFYAYSPYFKGQINVAVGDVDGDGVDEIITGAGSLGGPHVRVFNVEGQLESEFFAYNSKLRTGVTVAVGDVDGDGVDEIITGAGRGTGPEVKVFDATGKIKNTFLAYGENFKGGVKIAVGDVDKDGVDEIITGAGSGGGPHVRVFESNGTLLAQFFAYNQNFRGGINIASGDIHGDGQAEIMVSVEENSVPTVRVFNYQGLMLSNFFVDEPNFLKGIYVGAGDLDGDGLSEIVAGKNVGGNAEVKVFDWLGNTKHTLMAHVESYRGGARPTIISN
ncbi:MAG: S8 family serine peptidase [Candidatus Buchananbacteria bacterium]|nr:S8 family serine peptidase [Candidatus Buchananbacteria bacterium]